MVLVHRHTNTFFREGKIKVKRGPEKQHGKEKRFGPEQTRAREQLLDFISYLVEQRSIHFAYTQTHTHILHSSAPLGNRERE